MGSTENILLQLHCNPLLLSMIKANDLIIEFPKDDRIFAHVNLGESLSEIEGTAHFPLDMSLLPKFRFRWRERTHRGTLKEIERNIRKKNMYKRES